MVFETPPDEIPAEAVGYHSSDEDVGIEDKPHETTRKTSSSV